MLLIIIIISNLAEIVDDVHYKASIFPATLTHAHSRFCQHTANTTMKTELKIAGRSDLVSQPKLQGQLLLVKITSASRTGPLLWLQRKVSA